MPINDLDRFPVETDPVGAKSLIRNGLMQSDMDAQNHRILNLDTTNLVLDELHTTPPVANKWFNSYDAGTHNFGIGQPAFINLAGNLTRPQQQAITSLGVITEGTWTGSVITAVKLPALNLIQAPLGNVSLNTRKITSLADPFDDTDAVNLRTLNARLPGIQPKAAVRIASDSVVPVAGLFTLDGVVLHDNDRVLLKDQAGGTNGIWNAHPGSWTRTVDANTPTLLNNAIYFVLEGATNSGKTFLQTRLNPCITDGCTTWATFVVYSQVVPGATQAGAGLDQTGNTIFAVGTANRISVGAAIDIDINYAGQDSIGIVGTIGQGAWEGDVVAPEFGGTGVANTGIITLSRDFTTTGDNPYNLTFVLGSGTELILPPLGTLATLAGEETFTNKHISADQVDSGVILITNGGTNADNEVNARNNLLPIQDGHGGQTLHTDGTNVYWA